MSVTDRESARLGAPSRQLDSDVAGLIDLAGDTILPPPNPTPEHRRAIANMAAPLFRGPVRAEDFAQVDVTDRLVESSDGTKINLRAYRPVHNELAATVLYIHGGGWVAGSVTSYEPEVLRLVTKTRMSVIAVEYRLSPEHPHPAAFEDCMAAARALVGGAAPLKALAGDSAGGNLALDCAIALRDDGIDLSALLLLYPVVDPGAQGNQSYRDNGEGYLLSGEDMAYYWSAYLGVSPEGHTADFPYSTERLTGLPATVLVTAGFDPLRDEGRHLAAELVDADVPIIYLPNPSLTHGFQQMVPRIPAASRAVDNAYSALAAVVSNTL